MQEFDLNSIWNEENQAAEEHYTQIASEVTQLAQQNSANILHKVLRNSKLEIYVTLLLTILFILVFQKTSFKIIMAIAGLGSTWFAIHLYRKLRTNIHSVISSQTIHAIQEYIYILQHYIRRLTIYTYIFTPIGFILGVGGGIIEDLDTLTFSDVFLRLFLSSLFASPVLVLIIWLIKKYYIHWLYGKHLNSLKDILSHLKSH